MARQRKWVQQLEGVTVEAVQAGAEWLADYMRNLVSIQCGARGENRGDAFDRQHAPEGKPPYRETGEGQESIFYEPIEGGAIVGARNIGVDRMAFGNYMAGWDMPQGIRGFHHPWLSLFFKDKSIQKQFMAVVREAMRAKVRVT